MAEEEIKIKQPPVLYKKTQPLVQEATSLLGGPFLTYWNGNRGSVCHNDVLAFYELLEKIGKTSQIYLFIKSNGGNGKASLRIINLIRQYCQKLTVLVPLECASAATMMAIGADNILMGPMAYLSAVDTSLTHDLSPIDRDNERVSVSLDELKRVVKLWRSAGDDSSENPYKFLYNHIHPLVVGAVDRAESLSLMLCKELLSYHMQEQSQIEEIADILNSKYPSHGYPIMASEARKIGLNVDAIPAKVHDILLSINEMYSEMGQSATTDFDEIKSHNNEILNILETNEAQVYYQNDKDWFYRKEERRWITLNDHSSWRKIENINGKMKQSILHIS